MNLEDVKKFMKEVGYGILATSDATTVGARPMSGLAWKDNELWCATGEPSKSPCSERSADPGLRSGT